MNLNTKLSREIPATAIPVGLSAKLPAGLAVYVMQSLGGNVTVRSKEGLFRVSAEHADAIIGYSPKPVEPVATGSGEFSEQVVWAALKTCFDPEIPVNIVDLGLVYDLSVEKTPEGGHAVEVKMTLTAPGCGMGPVIAEDARQKVAALPTVCSAKVHIVWEPVWSPQLITPDGKKMLGLE